MVEKRHLKLFMASPSDTVEERKAFTEVIEALNRSRGKEGYHLDPILWENNAYPDAGNPQEIINKLFADADLVVVVFWNKYGAPTERFPSGTVEELSLALQRNKNTGTPSVKTYFRTPLSPKDTNEREELGKISKLKEEIRSKVIYRDYSSPEDFKTLLSEHVNAWLSDRVLERRAKSIPRSKPPLDAPSTLHDNGLNIFQVREETYDDKKAGLRFGIDELDNVIGEIGAGNFILICGDIASGKSSLLFTLLRNVSVNYKFPVLLFSMKVSTSECIQKLFSSESEVALNSMRRGEITKKRDWGMLTVAAGRLSEAPILIDDTTRLSVADMRDQIARAKDIRDIKLVVLDDLNYIRGPKSKIGDEIRLLSRELNMPVVATIGIKTKPDPMKPGIAYDRPVPAEWDQLGNLKSDADVIIFLYRSVDPSWDRDHVDIVVAKNSFGPTATISRYFNASNYSFGENVDSSRSWLS